MFTVLVDAAGEGLQTEPFVGTIGRDRLLEGTQSRLRHILDAMSEEALERYLLACPVLWTPEFYREEPEANFARIGSFTRLRIGDRDVQYTFEPYEHLAPIEHSRFADRELEAFFRAGEWGWHRTKLTVHDDDLFVLMGSYLVPAPQPPATPTSDLPALFDIEPTKRYDRMVSVMMPFTIERLTPVFAKIDRECARAQIYCERADTEQNGRRIIDKVANLIYHADAVICDFTGANPNVYYEAGLAHAWGRKTIFLAERGTVLPFDTRDEATIIYDNTDHGLKELWYQILERLQTIPQLFPPAASPPA